MFKRSWFSIAVGLAACMGWVAVSVNADQQSNSDQDGMAISVALDRDRLSDGALAESLPDSNSDFALIDLAESGGSMGEFQADVGEPVDGEPRGGCNDFVFQNPTAGAATAFIMVAGNQYGQGLTLTGTNRAICQVTADFANTTAPVGSPYSIRMRIWSGCPTANSPPVVACGSGPGTLLYGPVDCDTPLLTTAALAVATATWTVPDIQITGNDIWITFDTLTATANGPGIVLDSTAPTNGTVIAPGGFTLCSPTQSGCNAFAVGTAPNQRFLLGTSISANPGLGTGACCNNNVAPCIVTTAANCADPLDRFVPDATCATAVFNPPCGTFVAGDLCTNPIVLPTQQIVMQSFTTVGAFSDDTPTVSCTTPVNGQIFHDIWFNYTVPTIAPATSAGGTIVVSTVGSDHDTIVVVYGPIIGSPTQAQICTGIDNGTIPEVACDDDIRPENLLSFTTVDVPESDSGARFVIRVGTFSDLDFGTGMLNVDFVPNSDGINYLNAGRCCSADGATCTIVNRAACEAFVPTRYWQDATRFMEGADPTLLTDFPESTPIGCKSLPCPTLGGACYNAIDLENTLGGPNGSHTRGIKDKIYFKYTLGPNETVVVDSCGSTFDSVIEVYASVGDFNGTSNGDCGNLIKINDDCVFEDIDGTSEGASQAADCFAPAGEFTSCLCVSRSEVDAFDPAANGRIIIAIGGFNPFRDDTNVAAIDPVLNPFDPSVSLTINAEVITECFVCDVVNEVDGQPVTPINETEPQCSDGTSNRTNDFCNIPDPGGATMTPQVLPVPTPGNPVHVRGTAGVYVDSVYGQRPDNDWYEINFPGNVTVEFRLVSAEFPARISIFRAGAVDPCLVEAASSVLTTISCVDTEDFFTENLCAGRYFFRIRPEVPNKPSCDSAYLFRISAAAPPAQTCCKGDTDLSGVLDALDIQGFVDALTQGVFDASSFGPCFTNAFCSADMNNSGTLTVADVGPFVTALLNKTPCAAQPLCSNPNACQLPDLANALTSDVEPDLRVADNFTPKTSGNITNVCWWGMYLNFDLGVECSTGTTDAFTITFYADNAGCPGTQISSQSVTASRSATGQLILDTFPEFQYQATLTTPVAVVRDQCFWIEIRNNVSGTDCFWLWESSAGGDLNSVQDVDGLPYVCPADDTLTDNAFCLNLNIGDTGCVDLSAAGQCCYLDESEQSVCVQTDIDRCILQFNGYFFDFGGVCGVDACPEPPCEVECQPGDILENEGCGFDKNGGCNDAGAVFPPIQSLGVLTCGTPLNICGSAFSDGETRDTDWYQFQTSAEAQVSITLTSRFDGVVQLLRLQDCENITVVSTVVSAINDCTPVAIQACLQPGTYTVLVAGSDTFSVHECEVNSTYRLEISCSVPCCTVTCPGGTTAEAEACGADTNGGCNNDPDPPTFEPLGNVCTTPATRCGTSWADGDSRDTDWWGPFTLAQPTTVNWSLRSEFPGVAFAVRVDDCAALVVGDETASSVGCQLGSASECLPAGQWVIFVGPGNADGSGVFNEFPCGSHNDYILTVNCGGACTPVGEANDLCADAIDVTANINGQPVNGDTTDANTEPGDLPHSCHWSGDPTPAELTVWYKVTAPANGSVTVDVCSTTGDFLDSSIAVYSGTCGSLTEVGCDDDGCTGAAPYYSTASVTGLMSGQVYLIQIGNTGFTDPTAPGPFVLTLTSP